MFTCLTTILQSAILQKIYKLSSVLYNKQSSPTNRQIKRHFFLTREHHPYLSTSKYPIMFRNRVLDQLLVPWISEKGNTAIFIFLYNLKPLSLFSLANDFSPLVCFKSLFLNIFSFGCYGGIMYIGFTSFNYINEYTNSYYIT